MNRANGFTILTEPINTKGRIRESIKTLVGRHRQYGGHSTVTKGLVEGLEKIGYEKYNYRPKEKDLYDTVHVLAGVKTLQYAIELKKAGRIKNLSAGPNIVVFSDDYDGIIASKEVDLCITPSMWVSNDYIRREPSLEKRIAYWPVGVDVEHFKPQKLFGERKTKRVLIYHKDESDQFCWHLERILKDRGYQTYIIEYGSYTIDQYIDLLNEVEFMVAISRQESEGIFMPEAWSMDVPTICYDRKYYRWPGTDRDIEGDISCCPYLHESNGVSFSEVNEFERILDNWNAIKEKMSPREWCIHNMSDTVCAKRFIEILNDRFEL